MWSPSLVPDHCERGGYCCPARGNAHSPYAAGLQTPLLMTDSPCVCILPCRGWQSRAALTAWRASLLQERTDEKWGRRQRSEDPCVAPSLPCPACSRTKGSSSKYDE